MVQLSDPSADRAALVRTLWDAMRNRDVDAAMELMHDDIEWVPLVTESGPVHGADAVRHHLDAVVASGIIADAYPLEYEDVGGGRVLMSGALRVRRPDHWLATVQRWWVYVIADGRIRRAQAFTTREDALASPGGV